MATRAILLCVLAAILFTGIVRADDAVKLTGSLLKTEEAVSKSDAVFIGQITHLGTRGFAGPGESGLSGNEIKASQVLKGSFDTQATSSFNRLTDLGEQRPDEGTSYIFFVTKNSQTNADFFTILKLLPFTKDNEKTVIFAILRAKANAKLLEIENDKK